MIEIGGARSMRGQPKLMWIGAIFLGFFLLFLIAFLALRYDPSQLKGDARIVDNGFWSYPRYEIRFPKLSLRSVGTQTYECKGLPPEELTFMLEMPDRERKWEEVREFLRSNPNSKYSQPPDNQKYETLSRNRTVIEFTFIGNDKTIVSVTAPLQEWVLSWEPASNTGGFWRKEVRDLKFNPRVTYKLVFVIKETDPDGSLDEVVPYLKGGGMEW
jgi:hypothetical protein